MFVKKQGWFEKKSLDFCSAIWSIILFVSDNLVLKAKMIMTNVSLSFKKSRSELHYIFTAMCSRYTFLLFFRFFRCCPEDPVKSAAVFPMPRFSTNAGQRVALLRRNGHQDSGWWSIARPITAVHPSPRSKLSINQMPLPDPLPSLLILHVAISHSLPFPRSFTHSVSLHSPLWILLFSHFCLSLYLSLHLFSLCSFFWRLCTSVALCAHASCRKPIARRRAMLWSLK